MSETLTQAQVARVVRGAIKAHRDSGLLVGSVETVVSDGRVSVRVTGVADSVQHTTVATGGVKFRPVVRTNSLHQRFVARTISTRRSALRRV